VQLRDPDKPSLALSFACAAALSALFLLIYGGCLMFTAHRADVRTLYFAWELGIPLVPAMIVPYWSLDLFFVCSFFLCDTHRELRTLSLRLATAQLVAGMFFLLVPLRTAYPNPHIDGVFGLMFDALHGFDLPYNCAPSLHIAIAVVLWAAYVPKAAYGPVRMVVALWFGLIMASTLLTWQHHVIDVIGGAALGFACLSAFPAPSRRGHSAAPRRIRARQAVEERIYPGRRFALSRRGRVETSVPSRARMPRQRSRPRHVREARWDRWK
jgi:membrane-associated phospholipid phosphatase